MIAARQFTLAMEPLPEPPYTKETTLDKKVGRPIRVRLHPHEYSNMFLHFWCYCYSPTGAEPGYISHKYDNQSQDCTGCTRIIDGIPFKASFHCRRDSHGSEYYPFFEFTNIGHIWSRQEKNNLRDALRLLWKVPA